MSLIRSATSGYWEPFMEWWPESLSTQWNQRLWEQPLSLQAEYWTGNTEVQIPEKVQSQVWEQLVPAHSVKGVGVWGWVAVLRYTPCRANLALPRSHLHPWFIESSLSHEWPPQILHRVCGLPPPVPDTLTCEPLLDNQSQRHVCVYCIDMKKYVYLCSHLQLGQQHITSVRPSPLPPSCGPLLLCSLPSPRQKHYVDFGFILPLLFFTSLPLICVPEQLTI